MWHKKVISQVTRIKRETVDRSGWMKEGKSRERAKKCEENSNNNDKKTFLCHKTSTMVARHLTMWPFCHSTHCTSLLPTRTDFFCLCNCSIRQFHLHPNLTCDSCLFFKRKTSDPLPLHLKTVKLCRKNIYLIQKETSRWNITSRLFSIFFSSLSNQIWVACLLCTVGSILEFHRAVSIFLFCEQAVSQCFCSHKHTHTHTRLTNIPSGL